MIRCLVDLKCFVACLLGDESQQLTRPHVKHRHVKKRQEIGRGMRIPINQLGERIIPAEYNVLTVIANENYKEYVSKLQQEYVDEYGSDVAPPKIANARNRTTLKLKKTQDFPDFDELWKQLSKRTKYKVNIDSRIFKDQCVNEIKLDHCLIRMVRIKSLSL